MPVLAREIRRQGKPAPATLRKRGPCVTVVVSSVGPPRKGFRPKRPERGFALIDTGASSTAIDNTVARAAGLAIVGRTLVGSATGVSPAPVYVAKVIVMDGRKKWLDYTVLAHGVNIKAHQGLVALIGRDVLSGGKFIYDGANAAFEWSMLRP